MFEGCFCSGGWEVVNPDKPTGGGSAGDGGERARRRAQKRIETLIRANPALDVFWTLTISPDAITENGTAIDRTDYDAVCKNFNNGLLIEFAAVVCFMLLFLNTMISPINRGNVPYISTALRTIRL